MKLTVLVRMTYLVEVSEEEFEGRDIIDEVVRESGNLKAQSVKFPFELNGTTSFILESDGKNCGRCLNCGQWTTDKEKPGSIEGICNGARVNGKLLCDECLPSDHRWAF